MIEWIMGFGIKNIILLGIVLAAITAVGLYWNDRTQQIIELRSTNATLTSDLQLEKERYTVDVAKLKSEIESQNASIKEANDKHTQTEQSSTIATQIAAKQHADTVYKLQKRIKLLEAVDTPTSCVESIELIADAIISNPWIQVTHD